MNKTIFYILLATLMSWNITACNFKNGNEEEKVQTDLPGIKERGELVALTLYSSTSYFNYRGEPMGFQYELCEQFAQSIGVKLRIEVANSKEELIRKLQNGEGDLIAYNLLVTNEQKDSLIYCGEEILTHQVLVQRNGRNALKDVTEMPGKEIYVNPGRYLQRLNNLNNELGGGLIIQTVPEDSLSEEDLIERVALGKIDYTVCDSEIARMNKTYYSNLNISLNISFNQRSSWAVRMNSPLLAQAINTWSTDTRRNPSFKAITKRYFELSKTNEGFEIPEIKDGHLSPYDDLFRKHARLLDWDWRLLASISYQESKFNPHVVSWAGAEGLMGIIPSTARRLGVAPHELKDPDTSIRTGVDCLRRFRQGFSRIEDPEEKIKFTLAAYNAGIGHVYDAQRLAEKYGKDPLRWDDNVAEFIRLKNDPEYYNDPVCKHGYLRGSETFNYVNEILARYKYYKKKRP